MEPAGDPADRDSLYNRSMEWLKGSKQAESRRLVSQLRDPARREHAASQLIRIGGEAVPALIEALHANDASLDSQVVQILVRIGPVAIPALSKTMQEAHPLVRAKAAEALGGIKDRIALPVLLDALRGEFYTVRTSAAAALGEIGDPQAMPALIAALKDTEPQVRIAAVLALGRFELLRTFEAMANVLLDDPKIEVRQAAARALGGTHNPAALPYLMEALRDSFWWFEREAAAADLLQAIKGMGEAAVVPVIEALGDPEGTVRRYAATILGEMREGRAVEPLGMALYDMHHEVGTAAAIALSRIGAASMEALREAASHPEPGIRENVALALGGISDIRSGEILTDMLLDPDRSVQKQAVASLGQLQDARFLPVLESLAADRSDREMQALARAAIDRLRQGV